MKVSSVALGTACALALVACERAPDEPEPAPSPQVTATADEPVSIIRSDLEIERQAPPPAPLEMRVGFPEGGTTLDQAAQAELATLLQAPQIAAGGQIVLRGHTDSKGRDEANLRVSRARAEAVRDWLVERGVDEDRIRVIAMGEQNPIAPNALPDGSPNEAGRRANRRVEVSISVPPGAPAAPETAEAETLVDEFTR